MSYLATACSTSPCGSGNTTIAAARCFAEVTGIDFVPELLERGRVRAAAEFLEIDFVGGDAQKLPFEDGAFDVLLSTFGASRQIPTHAPFFPLPDRARRRRETSRCVARTRNVSVLCVRAFDKQTTRKCQFTDVFSKPSDGLEPSTPSLPCALSGDW
jgi:hypothetical protein